MTQLKSQFNKRHGDVRWHLLIPALKGPSGFAARETQKAIQQYLPYVLPTAQLSSAETPPAGHLGIVGTSDEPLIRQLIEQGTINKPEGAESYSVYRGPSPWDANYKLMVVAGNDASGTLYGSQELAAQISMEGHLLDGYAARQEHLEACPDFSFTEKPAIARRGIWTWGYAIYSYRSYIDNMVKLKFNTIIIWNDKVPVNILEVIEYAHSKGVKVVLGFHCGWGHSNLNLSSTSDRAIIVQNVFKTYQEQYAHLPHDGIYFQTLTEHSERALCGASTASWVTRLANETGEALLNEYPNLRIEFGIHGTSIGKDDVDLEPMDPRIVIVWEDCGSVPYAYFAHQTENYDQTLEWSKRLATLRPNNEFSMVAKGWMQLRWERDFENHSDFIMGEQSKRWIQKRLTARESEWNKINYHWCKSYPLAASFYRDLLQINPNLTVTGLVEDGLLEEKVQPSVALFGETLWNPYRSDNELLARANRPFLNE